MQCFKLQTMPCKSCMRKENRIDHYQLYNKVTLSSYPFIGWSAGSGAGGKVSSDQAMQDIANQLIVWRG